MFELPLVFEIIGRVLVVYCVVLAGIRLSGKREMGQMTPFDFVMLLLIANAVQNAMLGDNTSLWGGIIAALTLIVANAVLTRLVWKSKTVRHIVEWSPTVLINDGRVIEHNLARERITNEILREALREHGVADVSDVRLAMLEMDGSVSIIRYDDLPSQVRPHHRIRHIARKG